MPFLTNCGMTWNTHQFRMLIRNHNATVHFFLTVYAAISAVTQSTARLTGQAMYGFPIVQEEQFADSYTRICARLNSVLLALIMRDLYDQRPSNPPSDQNRRPFLIVSWLEKVSRNTRTRSLASCFILPLSSFMVGHLKE